MHPLDWKPIPQDAGGRIPGPLSGRGGRRHAGARRPRPAARGRGGADGGAGGDRRLSRLAPARVLAQQVPATPTCSAPRPPAARWWRPCRTPPARTRAPARRSPSWRPRWSAGWTSGRSRRTAASGSPSCSAPRCRRALCWWRSTTPRNGIGVGVAWVTAPVSTLGWSRVDQVQGGPRFPRAFRAPAPGGMLVLADLEREAGTGAGLALVSGAVARLDWEQLDRVQSGPHSPDTSTPRPKAAGCSSPCSTSRKG